MWFQSRKTPSSWTMCSIFTSPLCFQHWFFPLSGHNCLLLPQPFPVSGLLQVPEFSPAVSWGLQRLCITPTVPLDLQRHWECFNMATAGPRCFGLPPEWTIIAPFFLRGLCNSEHQFQLFCAILMRSRERGREKYHSKLNRILKHARRCSKPSLTNPQSSFPSIATASGCSLDQGAVWCKTEITRKASGATKHKTAASRQFVQCSLWLRKQCSICLISQSHSEKKDAWSRRKSSAESWKAVDRGLSSRKSLAFFFFFQKKREGKHQSDIISNYFSNWNRERKHTHTHTSLTWCYSSLLLEGKSLLILK